MVSFATVVGHKLFLNFGVPLIAVAVSIFVKSVSRNDAHTFVKKEDFAFGFDLMISSMLIFVTSMSAMASRLALDPKNTALSEKLEGAPWLIASFLIVLWGLSTLVRKIGWDGEDRLNYPWGIFMPCLFGVS